MEYGYEYIYDYNLVKQLSILCIYIRLLDSLILGLGLLLRATTFVIANHKEQILSAWLAFSAQASNKIASLSDF